MSRIAALLVFLHFIFFFCSIAGHRQVTVSSEEAPPFDVLSCRSDYQSAKCAPFSCGRRIIDGLFSEKEVARLHDIAEKGMSQRTRLGGPTILDINTGYIRDSAGLENLFMQSQQLFTPEDFEHYGNIIRKLKASVMDTFQLSELYFTAPTFITRLDGNSSWQPSEIHDEYWHTHVDMNNTEHYQYSGLLYMSTYGQDFDGGLLKFLSADDLSQEQLTVEPKAGRVALFTSGSENPHLVERVTSGSRLVLSFWFTCDPSREFEIFLDGHAHTTFSNKIRSRLEQRQKQQQQQQNEQQQQHTQSSGEL